MKIVTMGDLHLSAQTPINRKDDYASASLRKLRQLIDYVNESADLLVVPGDFFDKPTAPVWYLNRVIAELSRLWRPAVIIPGNHDLPQHNLGVVRDCALWTLHSAEIISLFPLGSHDFAPAEAGGRWVTIHTCPFGCDPSTLKPVSGTCNILVAHIPVFEKAVPFYMLDGMTAGQLEAACPGFDWYLVGDIHEPAIVSNTIVTGSMMRRTIAQADFRPAFWVIDTETQERQRVEFKIEEDIWKTGTEIIEDESYRAELAGLTETLRQRAEKPDYPAAVRQLAGDSSMGSEIQKKIQGYIDDYTERT